MADKIIYSKYSNDRAEQYRIVTDIIERNGKKMIRKKALNSKAVTHIEKIGEHEQMLNSICANSRFCINQSLNKDTDYIEFEYIEGKSYETILDQYLGKNDIDGLIGAMHSFFEELGRCETGEFIYDSMFEYYFGNVNIPSGTLSMKISDIDLIFQNVIVDTNGQWNVIDYEWTLDCMVPLRYIQYRAIYLYIYTQSKRECLISCDVFAAFHFSEEEKQLYRCMEGHFQNVIKEEHKQLGDYYQMIGKPAANSKSVFEEIDRNVIKIYFDEGNGFSEENCKKYEKFPIKIDVYDGLKTVQIVPMYERGLIKVNALMDQNGDVPDYNLSGVKLSDALLYFGDVNPCIAISVVDTGITELKVDLSVSRFDINMVREFDDLCNKVTEQRIALQSERSRTTALLSNLQQKDNLIKGTQEELDAMKDSVSWKITKPIRTIGDSINKK